MKVSFFSIIKKLIVLALVILLAILVYSSYLTFKCPLLYVDTIMEYSEEFSVDPYLIAAVINTESDFNLEAKSPKGAIGLMQIMPDTGAWIGEKLEVKDYSEADLYKASVNIRFGTWYLKFLSDKFDGNEELLLAAYNAGSGNVNKWLANREYSLDGKNLDKIPFKETENYIVRVKESKELYQKIYTDQLTKRHDIKDNKLIEFLNKLKIKIKNSF